MVENKNNQAVDLIFGYYKVDNIFSLIIQVILFLKLPYILYICSYLQDKISLNENWVGKVRVIDIFWVQYYIIYIIRRMAYQWFLVVKICSWITGVNAYKVV